MAVKYLLTLVSTGILLQFRHAKDRLLQTSFIMHIGIEIPLLSVGS